MPLLDWLKGLFAGKAPAAAAPAQPGAQAPAPSAERASLLWLQLEVLPKLEGWHFSLLSETLEVSGRALSKIEEMEKAGALIDADRALFRRMLASYLPDAARAYMRLGIRIARKSRIDGKSPSELFCGQLRMMRQKALDVEAGFHKDALDAVAAQGAFLRERLGGDEWDKRF